MSENDAIIHITITPEMLEKVIVGGDLSKLSPAERLNYYNALCQSLNLNPLTRPFEYIVLNGRLTLYARRDATDQLRRLHRVSVSIVARETVDSIYVVTARATMPDGRTDEAIGAVSLDGLKGDALANAMMKAETKAKRRVTLSICGLGFLDETETETIPSVRVATEQLAAPPAPALPPAEAAEAKPAEAKVERPYPPDVLRTKLELVAEGAQKAGKKPEQDRLDAAVALLEKMGNLRAFLKAMFGVGSVEKLTPAQQCALVAWVKPEKWHEGNEWVPGPYVPQEFAAVVSAAASHQQQTLPM